MSPNQSSAWELDSDRDRYVAQQHQQTTNIRQQTAYNVVCNCHLSEIDNFENICLCCFLHIPYTVHITEQRYDFKLVPNLRFHMSSILDGFGFVGHVTRTVASLAVTRAPKMSTCDLPRDWKRPPGHPRHTSLCTLKINLHPHNLGLTSAWRYIQDRSHWKKLIETAMFQRSMS